MWKRCSAWLLLLALLFAWRVVASGRCDDAIATGPTHVGTTRLA